MMLFFTFYILGSLVSLGLCYRNNKTKHYDKMDLDVALFISVCSWLTAVVLLGNTAFGSDWFWRLNKKFKGE